jgi:hypothetical protein
MLKIKKLKLKNYSGFKEETSFSFTRKDGTFKPINVFYGPNGCGKSTGTLWGRLWSSGQATSQPVRGSGVGYTFTVSPTSGLVYQVTSAVDDVVDAVPGLKTAAKGVEKAKEAVDKAKEAKIEWMKQLAKAWGIPFTILGGLL